ncbi:hypothetical protein CDG76_17650 [Nostoc sp. 'Peltigera membranacea cyanobiont' 210A]|uniref:hypothetical protein n=1 Tax=Nostoc sp. 'Peltigera membranacea cyanobiont' 210A TaxID=2014529 RepID=UPI000B95AAA8|nr:hypothetical protein [Nostoc sp. 'Peltigera membranacea cyanobiont' 210A]OYD93799.1 hypothetical protein CDG76_17650 [Nostoc sp. 'Peltigera membranacea cyanobiont' 210A]
MVFVAQKLPNRIFAPDLPQHTTAIAHVSKAFANQTDNRLGRRWTMCPTLGAIAFLQLQELQIKLIF